MTQYRIIMTHCFFLCFSFDPFSVPACVTFHGRKSDLSDIHVFIVIFFSLGLKSQADDSLLRYPRSPSLQPAGDAWQHKHICFKGMTRFSTLSVKKGYSCNLQALPTVLITATELNILKPHFNMKRKRDNHVVISLHNKIQIAFFLTSLHPNFVSSISNTYQL